MVTKGEKGGGISCEIETDICTLLYIKQITNKNLLYKKNKYNKIQKLKKKKNVSQF